MTLALTLVYEGDFSYSPTVIIMGSFKRHVIYFYIYNYYKKKLFFSKKLIFCSI